MAAGLEYLVKERLARQEVPIAVKAGPVVVQAVLRVTQTKPVLPVHCTVVAGVAGVTTIVVLAPSLVTVFIVEPMALGAQSVSFGPVALGLSRQLERLTNNIRN